MLWKFEKKNYTKSLLYRLIALLNTLNKVLKSIILKRIYYVVETLKTFLNTQINARRQRSINTILQFIMKKIHTIWNEQKKRMTLFFNLNVSGAFDNMSHIRLFYNMKKRKMSSRLLKWVENFLKNKNITLIIEEYT